ncbi:acyl-coenzyme A thioesterase 13-like [Saccoglossus kowalevskii]|uniref:Acyl-coenzyme A thioesterase 13-like n=1 Tax=Saccoglossus kowalevskii TaxID=10224 RepID=A0ABM0MPH7_SACKO|nr:PREDICTED: acyl-coenzyme A thioesterase 13-like [Saccoglossus kowalevskii]
MAASSAAQAAKEIIRRVCIPTTFNGLLRKANVISAKPGELCCEMEVESIHANRYDALHGGMTSTMIDTLSTIAVLVHHKEFISPVSTDLNVSFLKGASIGEKLFINAKILKSGKSFMFITVDIKNDSGILIAQGRHTMASAPSNKACV